MTLTLNLFQIFWLVVAPPGTSEFLSFGSSSNSLLMIYLLETISELSIFRGLFWGELSFFWGELSFFWGELSACFVVVILMNLN